MAALAVPVVLKSAKPLVRTVGKGLKDLGESLMKEAAETEEKAPEEKVAATEQPKPKTRRTTKKVTPKPRTNPRAKDTKVDES